MATRGLRPQGRRQAVSKSSAQMGRRETGALFSFRPRLPVVPQMRLTVRRLLRQPFGLIRGFRHGNAQMSDGRDCRFRSWVSAATISACWSSNPRARSCTGRSISGVTLFDTADVYGNRGGSEEQLGAILGSRRKDIVLATKFGMQMDDAGVKSGASRRYIFAAVEASLKRLQTDWIDLYQVHRPDGKRRSMNRSRRSTISFARARCAISAARISRLAGRGRAVDRARPPVPRFRVGAGRIQPRRAR